MFLRNRTQKKGGKNSSPPKEKRRRLLFEPLEERLALSVTLLSEDFESDLVDTIPSSADYTVNASGPEGFIQIAGPGGMFGNPFPPSGNQALVISNPGDAQPVIAWTDEFSDDPTQFRSGSISFDIFLPEPGFSFDHTYIDVRFGFGDANRTAPTTVGDTTIRNTFRINAQSPDVIVDAGNGTASVPIQSQSILHVEYFIDGNAETYQVHINDAPVLFDGNLDRPWIAGAQGINMVAFVGAFPDTSAPLSIDNLVVLEGEDVLPQPWTRPTDEPTDRLEWYQHRGNKRLTGLAQIDDNIVSGATVLWSKYIGGRESWVGLASTSSDNSISLPTSNQTMSQSERVSWGIGGPYFDLNDTGTLTSQSTYSARIVGDFIPDNGVLELLELDIIDLVNPAEGDAVVRLSTRVGSSWSEVWESPVLPKVTGAANLIVGDFDDDGSLEVALTPWYDIYVLSMATGQIEDSAYFVPSANESGRPYGWLGAYDLNGNGRDEFVLMGDFQDFISVMGYNDQGDLVKLWEHVFEPQLAFKQTLHRPGAFPVRDITGDGLPEIVTSIYNETDDEHWHLRVFDGATGTPVYDLIDHTVDGARDIDGDGNYELFVRETVGSLRPTLSTVKILDWNGNGFNTVWSQENAELVSQDIAAFPVNVNSATSTTKLDLLTGKTSVGGHETFFSRQVLDASTSLTKIETWQWDANGNVSLLGSATGTDLDVLAVREAEGTFPGVLLSAEVFGTPAPVSGDFNLDGVVNSTDLPLWSGGYGISTGATPGNGDADGDGDVDGSDFLKWQRNLGKASANVIQLSGFTGQNRYSAQSAPPRVSAVVGRLDGPTSAPTVVVQGGSQHIAAFQPTGIGQSTDLWDLPGIGGSQGATQFTGQHDGSGVALGDVTGDGSLETIFATVGDAGQARLVAVRSDGSEAWHTDFNLPGGRRIFNEPGLTLWRTGHFTTQAHEDVLVQTMRGTGGTGQFHLLDGQTGSVLWSRTYGNTPGTYNVLRAAGEAQMAVYDWDGDGLDEAVNFHPDLYYVVDGTGDNLIDANFLGGGIFPGSSPLYGTPIVDDFLGNGTDTILWAGGYSQLGLISKVGTDIWHKPLQLDNFPGFIQGVGDIDGNGTLDLLSPGHPIAPATYTQSLFYAMDAATGNVLWTLPLPGLPYGVGGGATSSSPTLSISADIDQDGRDESIFAISNVLIAVGANPDGTSGSIEWSFGPDQGLLSSPIIADANGDGVPEIIVVSTSGMVYGIGVPPGNLASESELLANSYVMEDTESPVALTEVSADSPVDGSAMAVFPQSLPFISAPVSEVRESSSLLEDGSQEPSHEYSNRVTDLVFSTANEPSWARSRDLKFQPMPSRAAREFVFSEGDEWLNFRNIDFDL